MADDAVVHCATERQAEEVLAALGKRMAEVGLQLHPDKTRIVFCKDRKRRYAHCEHTSFTFLGYTFRARNAPTRDGTSMFTGFLPAVSKDALKRMSEEVRLLAHPPAHRHGTERPGLVGQPRRRGGG